MRVTHPSTSFLGQQAQHSMEKFILAGSSRTTRGAGLPSVLR